MQYCLHIVTGAPGAGKSTAVDAFVRLGSDYLAFDMDWLADAASHLSGKDIRFAPSLWKPYNELWLAVLLAVHQNGKTPVLFAPIDQRDMERNGLPQWCRRMEWMLLDCDDATRRSRLRQRPGWTNAMREEAVSDAASLRKTVSAQIDTGTHSPNAVAVLLLEWIEKNCRAVT